MCTLLRGLGRPGEALQVIREAEAAGVEPRWRDELAVLRATAAINQGRQAACLLGRTPVSGPRSAGLYEVTHFRYADHDPEYDR